MDIDPSFPGEPRKLRLIQDFLGDRSISIRDWVEHGPTPRFLPYLLHDTVDQAQGPWILLDGHCSQQDKSAERIGFVMIQSFLLLDEDVEEFIRLIKKETPRGKWLPESAQDHYTFAGEIPWCDTFPHNELSTVDFITGKVKVKGSPNDPRYSLRIILDFGDSKQTVESEKPPEFEEINKYRRIVVYVPIRENSFSSGGGIERPSGVVPAKELADHFGLWPRLPSWEMHDQSGRRCSIVLSDGKFFDYERHLFLRKELIDNLLSSQKLALVWVAWGERQHFNQRHAMTNAQSHGYRYFQQVYRYTRQGHVKSVL